MLRVVGLVVLVVLVVRGVVEAKTQKVVVLLWRGTKTGKSESWNQGLRYQIEKR